MLALYSFGAKHSERLPQKNYKMLCGIEVCRYTFDFVKNNFSNIPYYVFTDSKIIKRIAEEYEFFVIECSKASREGLEGSKMVHRVIGADMYCKLPFTNPIRDIENVKQNLDLCINSNILQGYAFNIKNLLTPKPTGSLHFWRKEQLDNPVDYNTVLLPDLFDFDIDYQEDFDRVKNYLESL
jgi:CMP-N-acetylneuraminic acid synthetase